MAKAIDKEDETERFKEFLNARGSHICQTSEFLPFYAMPYIPNPHEHESFKNYYTTKWARELRVWILNFLQAIQQQFSLQNTVTPEMEEIMKREQ